MRQGQASRASDLPRLAGMSPRKGTGVSTLLTGLVGFVLGLFFGWLLQRERLTRAQYPARYDTEYDAVEEATTPAEVDEVADLRAQLTDARHLLDEREATIAQLETELASFVDGGQVEDTLAIDPVDPAADAATVDVGDIDEADVTQEVATPETEEMAVPHAADDDTDVGQTQQDLSPIYDETMAIPAADQDSVDDETAVIERVAQPAVGDGRAIVDEPLEPVVDEPVVDEPVVDPTVVIDRSAVDEADVDVAPEAAEPLAEAPEPAVVAEPVAPAAGSGDVAAEGPFVPPPAAEPDNLQRLRGIGPAMERTLNAHGIVTFRQLAVLSEDGIDELGAEVPAVTGRIRRDRWVEQAQKLHIETHGDQP